jgi:hypothetical protein
LSDTDIEKIKKIALSEPLLVKSLISPSGHVTGVMANILLPGKSAEEVKEVTAFSRKLADDLRKNYSNIDIYLTGSVISDNAFGEASQKDMSTLIPAMFLTLIILVGLALRSFTGTIATLIVIMISMVTGLGLAGWFRISITAASVNAPTLILTLVVADSVHMLSIMFHQIHLGKTKREAIAESIRINLQPVFLTSVTTAIGFLTMNFSDAPPFRDLGNIVAMGVMAAFVFSVFSLPALMTVLPVRSKPKAESNCCSCNRLANFVIRRRKLVFWGMLVVIVGMTIGILRVEFNENFVKYFDKSFDNHIKGCDLELWQLSYTLTQVRISIASQA